MALRLSSNTRPIYGEGCNCITMVFRHSGQFVHVPTATYIGGETLIYDYVKVADVSLLNLDEMCEAKGLVGFKRYYTKVSGGFILLQTDKAVRDVCAKHTASKSDVYMYVDIDTSLLENELGLSDAFENREVVDDEDYHCEELDSDETDHEENVCEEIDAYADDRLFDEHVDFNEEWPGLNEEDINKAECGVVRMIDFDVSSDDLAASDDELKSIDGSDEEYVKEHQFDLKNMDDPELFCGLKFTDFKVFKKAVKNYSIKKGRPVVFFKSDKVRCRAKCKKSGCGWNIYARMMNTGKAEIRGFESNHTCYFSYRNPNVNSGWLATKYMSDFKIEPNPNIYNFMKKVTLDTGCHISKSQAYRARKKALDQLRVNQDYQFSLLQSYINEVKRNDKETTMVLQTISAERIEDDDHIGSEHQFSQRFFRLYCCLSALKQGMVVGCRKIFGIDGCHLKGDHGGMLLAAVGIDPNNSIFPIAYAITEGENKDSWIWFLDLLKKDLNIEMDSEWTIISDKQKGLIQACEHVFPAAEHRFCVRHLHANWVLAGFTGGKLKAAFYQAAKATTVVSFTEAMKLIQGISNDAFKWLHGKPPQHWSRSHFSTSLKCDAFTNNGCESFNKTIRYARQLPPVSMLEEIKTWLMVRFQEKRDKAKNNWGDSKICPRIKKILKENIKLGARIIPYKSDEFKFECHQFDGMQYVVDLKDKVCSCRRWGITGIPCSHACAALSVTMADPEDYVDECYKVETYKRVYELAIQPVCGIKQLLPTVDEPTLPPVYKKQPGRPKTSRHKSQGEDELAKIKKVNEKGKEVKKLSRAGLKCKCSNCGIIGHNIRKCPDRNKNANEKEDEQPHYAPFECQESNLLGGFIQEGTTSTHGNQGEEIEVAERVLQGKRKRIACGNARKNKKGTSSREVLPELGERTVSFTSLLNDVEGGSSCFSYAQNFVANENTG